MKFIQRIFIMEIYTSEISLSLIIGPLTDKKGFLGLISKSAFNQLADTSEMENLTCKELLKYQVLIES